jgi:hypothetical protein
LPADSALLQQELRFLNHTLEREMTCKFEDLGACAPILGKRVTFGAAASLMATLVVVSVGLLFSAPGSATAVNADRASVEVSVEDAAR